MGLLSGPYGPWEDNPRPVRIRGGLLATPPEALQAASISPGQGGGLLGGERVPYDPAGRPLGETVQDTFGLDPSMRRPAIIPGPYYQGGDREDMSNYEWAWPQWAYEMAKAVSLPGHVARGGEWTPRDALDMTFTVAGGGGAAGVGAAPKGVLASGGARPRQMELPLRGGQGVRLPLDAASRMGRADQLGFTEDVYHATRATQPFDEFRPQTGPQRHDLWGVHVGTREAADDRLRQYFGGRDYGTKSGVANEGQAGSIMPLRARIKKPYTKADGSPYTEAEIRKQVTAFARKRGLNPDRLDARRAFQKELREKGYDAIPYINSKEGRGSISYLIFDPRNIRSRFAKFDPAKVDSADLLAANASPLLTGGLLAPRDERR